MSLTDSINSKELPLLAKQLLKFSYKCGFIFSIPKYLDNVLLLF